MVHLKPITDKCCMNIPWTGASEAYHRHMLHEYPMDYGASEAYHRQMLHEYPMEYGASEAYHRQMLHEYLMDYGASEAYQLTTKTNVDDKNDAKSDFVQCDL